jgi:hypothetical protein
MRRPLKGGAGAVAFTMSEKQKCDLPRTFFAFFTPHGDALGLKQPSTPEKSG